MSTQENNVTRLPVWVRISTVLLGTLGLGLINWVFDYPLYGIVAERFTAFYGIVDGGLWTLLVMSFLSWVLSYLIIRYYDYTGRDLLGLEALKSARDVEHILDEKPRLLARFARLGDVPAFFVLGIYDPVYSTIYLRNGKELYNGFSRRDWVIFNLGVVYANVLWTSGWLSTIEFIRFVPWLIEWAFH